MRPVSVVLAAGLLLVVSGCVQKSPEELLRQAEQHYTDAARVVDSIRAVNGDVHALFQPAVEGFEKVVADAPGSMEAERALWLLATVYSNDTREPEKAIQTYGRYATAFPDGQQAPTALFLIGYVYNNELHNIDSAGAAYRRFLERFPQNEMASSARYELEHLGKSAEELLPGGAAPTTAEAKTKGK